MLRIAWLQPAEIAPSSSANSRAFPFASTNDDRVSFWGDALARYSSFIAAEVVDRGFQLASRFRREDGLPHAL